MVGTTVLIILIILSAYGLWNHIRDWKAGTNSGAKSYPLVIVILLSAYLLIDRYLECF